MRRAATLASILVLTTCTTSEATPQPRQGKPVARLAGLAGEVKVRPATDQPFKGTVGAALLADDVIEAPAGSYALVEFLANQCLARLDEELALRVDELAVYKSPRCRATLDEQSKALLTESEYRDGRARVVGYRAGMSAAETVDNARGPRPQEQKQVDSFAPRGAAAPQLSSPPASASAPPPAPPAAVRSTPRAEPREEPSEGSSPLKRKEAAPRGGAPGGSAKLERAPEKEMDAPKQMEAPPPSEVDSPADEARPTSDVRWWRVLQGKNEPQLHPAPRFAQDAAHSARFKACLAALLSRAGAPASGPEMVLVRIEKGRVVRATVRGLLLAGECARHLGDQVSGAADGWLGFEVPLP